MEGTATVSLESYLAKIRRDGVVKHADMKHRLDELAENNTAAVTLIKTYLSPAKTQEFSAAAQTVSTDAFVWRDRCNFEMELFTAGDKGARPLPFASKET
jgi:hypothetical protein